MPPVGEYVYRGNIIHFDDIKSLKIIGEIGNYYKLRSYKYTAHQKIQSWTTKFSIAKRFERVYNKSLLHDLPVIIMTKVKKSDFIMNPKFQNKLDLESAITTKEYETLRISNKPIMCDVFINKRKYNKWRKNMKSYNQLLIELNIISEAGQQPGILELVKTPLNKAKAYLESLFKKYNRNMDEELPEFENNYSNVQMLANFGRTKRKDMPVIDEKDVKLFQKRLKSGELDVNAPHSDSFSDDPFPEGLAGGKAKEWLEAGLPIHDNTNKKDDVVGVVSGKVSVGELKPIQQQIYFDKAVALLAKNGVEKSKQFLLKKSYFIVSNDNFIIDGHHRWLLANIIDKNMKVRVLKIDLPMTTLLPLTLAYGDAIGNKRNK